jgi:hypothetical protein
MTAVDDRVSTTRAELKVREQGRWTSARSYIVIGFALIATGTVTALSLLRTPGFGATDTIWAEDARQFYQGSVQHSYLSALFTPYNGYLHFIPRTLIEVVRFFPLAWASTVIAVIGALATTSCALLIYRAGARHLRSPALRIAVAAPVALPYVGQLELANNFASIHLFLLYVAFWMVIWNPARFSLRLLAAFLLFVTVASDPVAAVFLPLALLRCRAVPAWRGALPAIGIGAGLLFQSVGFLFRNALHGRGISPHYDPIWATKQFFETVVGQGLYTEHLNERLGFIVPAGDAHYLAWALGALVFLLAAARVTQPNWPLVIAAGVHSLLLFDGLAMQGGDDAPRYELPAICLLLLALAGALVPREGATERTQWAAALKALRSTPAFAALGLVALCVYGGYAQDMGWRAKGPSFDAQVAQAAVACQDPAAQQVAITVAPSFATWTMTVPCDLVRHRDDFFQLWP